MILLQSFVRLKDRAGDFVLFHVLEELRDGLQQGGLIAFDRQDVIGFRFTDRASDLFLTTHRVGCHDAIDQIE